ncbi:hypothetical protein KK083_04825 [Fulvivirgaceae bacterium PWU4]|uniref:Uncharacterized protein n=1 Tax=Chryseosolibacter histidini TaxID=2782349 RepID=A0AAP2DH27_9BACT|nr:hypothetical protein [Chryseosolibacter histidini]MBT1696185.1 hypothetical protein [Chryseosolibacter histidini]
MKLFNFIKKRSKTPAQILRHLAVHIPTSYTAHHQFKNYLEFLEHREWELALDSLIELADETPGYAFSDTFWLGLAEAADKMNLDKTREYCKSKSTGTTL